MDGVVLHLSSHLTHACSATDNNQADAKKGKKAGADKMQAASLPLPGKERLPAHIPQPTSTTMQANSHAKTPSEYTLTNSWATTYGLSSLSAERDDPPLAWVGIRHQVVEEEKGGDEAMLEQRGQSESFYYCSYLICAYISGCCTYE